MNNDIRTNSTNHCGNLNQIPPSDKKENPKGSDLSTLFPKQENSLKRKNEESSIPKLARLGSSIIEAQETLKKVSKRFTEIVLKQTSEQIKYHQQKLDEKSFEIYLKEIGRTGTDLLESAELLQLFILTDFYKQTEAHEKCKKSLKDKLSKDCSLFVTTFTSGDKRILQNDKLADFFTELFEFHERFHNDSLLAKLFPLLCEASKNPGIQFCLSRCYASGIGVEKNVQKEFEWTAQSAQRGDPRGQYHLGYLYKLGRFVVEDKIEAVKWFKKSVEGGHSYGQYEYGMFLYSGGTPFTFSGCENFSVTSIQRALKVEEGCKLIKQSAEGGYDRAQHQLGFLNINRYNDPKEAFKWYKKSAEQGVFSQYEVGLCYKSGYGVDKDLKKAFYWFQKSQSNEADYEVGLCYKNGHGIGRNLEEAFKYFRKSSSGRDNSEAKYEVGLCYKNGHGVEKNLKNAIECFKTSGNFKAHYELGLIFDQGDQEIGLAKDPEQALYWFQVSAKKNHSDATYMLGLYFAKGLVVDQNPIMAFKCFHKSAAYGCNKGKYELALCYANGFGVEKNLKEAFKLFNESAVVGLIEAQYELGNCYLNGFGEVKKDLDQAFYWYKKSAEGGHPDALFPYKALLRAKNMFIRRK